MDKIIKEIKKLKRKHTRIASTKNFDDPAGDYHDGKVDAYNDVLKLIKNI